MAFTRSRVRSPSAPPTPTDQAEAATAPAQGRWTLPPCWPVLTVQGRWTPAPWWPVLAATPRPTATATHSHPGRLEVGAGGLPTDGGGLLDAPQRPAQSPKRQNLLLLVVAQDVAHPGAGTRFPRLRQRLGPLLLVLVAGFQVSISGRFWVSTEDTPTRQYSSVFVDASRVRIGRGVLSTARATGFNCRAGDGRSAGSRNARPASPGSRLGPSSSGSACRRRFGRRGPLGAPARSWSRCARAW
jgi:hypothetical protein